MSLGTQHAAASILLAAPAGALAYAVGAGTEGALACAAGTLTGVVLSPDLDIRSRTHSEYVIYRYLGPLLGAAWFAFWWPYARLIRHRHPLSHWPVIGTLGRLLYLALVANLFWVGIVYLTTGDLQPIQVQDPRDSFLLVWGIIGLMLSDTVHFGMDLAYSNIGRPIRRWLR